MNIKITLETLRLIDSIERNHSFAEAAKEVNKVPSALSYSIKKLESDLGVELFDRSTYRLKLTEAGHLLLRRGRALLEEVRDLETELQTGTTPEPSSISIAIDVLFPFEWVTPIIHQFLEEFPNTHIKCSTEVLNGPWDALFGGRANIIIAGAPQPEFNIPVNSLFLGFIPHVFAVAPFHPLANHPEPLTTTDIQNHRLIYVSDTSQEMTRASSGYFYKNMALYVSNINAKLHCQLKGLGTGFLPKHLALPFIKSGELMEKKVNHPKQPTRVVVATLDSNTSQKIQRLKSLIGNAPFADLQ